MSLLWPAYLSALGGSFSQIDIYHLISIILHTCVLVLNKSFICTVGMSCSYSYSHNLKEIATLNCSEECHYRLHIFLHFAANCHRSILSHKYYNYYYIHTYIVLKLNKPFVCTVRRYVCPALIAIVLTMSAPFIELFGSSAPAPRVEPSPNGFLKVSVTSSGFFSCVVDPYTYETVIFHTVVYTHTAVRIQTYTHVHTHCIKCSFEE